MTSQEQQNLSELSKLPSTESKSKIYLKLFLTGFLQLCIVTVNTYLVIHLFYIAIFFTGFLISFIWSYNVKRIAFGDLGCRIAYALGSALGGTIGLHLIHHFL